MNRRKLEDVLYILSNYSVIWWLLLGILGATLFGLGIDYGSFALGTPGLVMAVFGIIAAICKMCD